MLKAWQAYKAGQRKKCLEHFAAAVQHDSPVQVHPRSDPAFCGFLVEALVGGQSLGVDAEAAAAAMAYLIVSKVKLLRLTDEEANARLEALAAACRGNWWVQYAQATWCALRQEQRKSAEALTRAILAGGPVGMYYSRARVYSYLERREQSTRDFRKFLELAPTDHPSVPDARYALALAAAAVRDRAGAVRELEAGQAAEAKVAPWVGYQDSEVKMTAQLFLSAM